MSFGLRAWTWHRWRVFIDIQALQISLLGGRIFFKGIRYHGNNETILIHSGFVTWSYWLRNVRELDINNGRGKGLNNVASNLDNHGDRNRPVDEEGSVSSATKLPCRLNVSLQGVEWFVYNKSAAYDAVLASMQQQSDVHLQDVTNKPEKDSASRFTLRKRGKDGDSEQTDTLSRNESLNSEDFANQKMPSGRQSTDSKLRKLSTSQSEITETEDQSTSSQDDPFILRFLPLHIDCTKAAVVLGNENTKSILITKVDKAFGEIDATRSNVLDQYRQLINFEFERPVIQMKPNEDYKEDQTTAAIRIKRGVVEQPESQDHIHAHSFLHRQRRKVWHTLQDLVPAFRSSVESFSSGETGPAETSYHNRGGSNNWQGLSRYLDENEQDGKARWSSIEYATVSTVVDCPKAKMCFYWDVVGNVQGPETINEKKSRNCKSNINGDSPPEWGIDLILNGATINYGPWADRQRADIQRVFFPSACKDAAPSKHLGPGEPRVYTEFKLLVQFDEETTLRVPIREESKNWKWAKQKSTVDARPGDPKRNAFKNRKRKTDKGTPGPEIRPFGWLDVTVAANATVVYNMDMVAGPSGFSNKLELDLPNIEITTSVNHGLLWRSAESRITCDLSNPLQWNGHHSWKFDVKSDGMELFILREHVFLLIDLVDDWASGPPPEYLTFSPFQYLVNLQLNNFKVYLNVNDSNIINNPSDFDDNTFIIIFGAYLNADICIPLDKYRPHRTDISFDVDAKHGGLNLHVPPWNTHATFLSSTEVATLKTLAVQGKYQYCATTSTSNTDTLLLDIYGDSASCHFYGFIIRYFLKIKDNYFGDDIRFKTLDEYQDVLRAIPGESSSIQPHKSSNDLDVILSVSADGSSVILPSNLYSAKNHTRIDIATLAADLRFTNYYMDLEVVLSSLAFSQGRGEDGSTSPVSTSSSTQLFVDGLNVTGNRLFGLPPSEPTYVCNWDFGIGSVSGECTADFFGRLASGVRAFAFTFDDDENTLPSVSELVLHDVTFLRASIESIRLWLHVEEAAFLLSTGNISVNFNDWAGSHYSKKMNLQIPDLQLACVNAESASRHRSRTQHPVDTHALIRTTLTLVMIDRKLDFIKDRQLQQEHIKRHDQRTHRTDFLLHSALLENSTLTPVDPPAMCVPPMPLPVLQADIGITEQNSMSSNESSIPRRNRFAGRKASFLSLSSVSQQSDRIAVRGHNLTMPGEHLSLGSRSRSLQTRVGPGHRTPLRDASASTGRQSSFYSAVGEHRGLPPSTVTFSSSFIAPYFPLEGVEPDAKDLPKLSLDSDYTSVGTNQFNLDDVDPHLADDKASHTSFILELPMGVTGVINPRAISAVAGLWSAMQAVDPVDILDEIQIDSMTKIFNLNKQKITSGSIVDFCARTPNINLRFLNSTVSEASQNARQDMHDQYDFSMSGLAVTLRSKSLALENGVLEDSRKSSALHFSLLSAGLSAKERFNDIDDAQAAVNAIIEDIVFWTASSEDNSASIVLKGVEVTTASSKVEYLASLVHRTTSLANAMVDTFWARFDHQKSRIQLFTYLVSTAGQKATDPLFLTKPSYVLRSASDHLRTSDSWKIITRLRHMYTSLDSSKKKDIAIRCLHDTELIPEDAQQRVLEGFSQWRSWDLNNIDACLVMWKVYGSAENSGPTPPQNSHPLKLSFRTERIRLILDPGPKQNEISLSVVTTTIESTTTVPDIDGDADMETQLNQTTSVQVFCSEISINLNWELCELADDILRLYHGSEPQPRSPVPRNPISSTRTISKLSKSLHITVATEKGAITIDTINIRALGISKGLKGSVMMTNENGRGTPSMVSIILAADAATSKIRSHSHELALYQLRHPSVYASYEAEFLNNMPDTNFKIAGNCQELSFVVRQDIPVLIEVVDLIIGDEAAQLYHLTGNLPRGRSSVEQFEHTKPPAASIIKVNIALFLDVYHISIPLLQSLTYNVSGVVARASVSAQLYSDVVFDFDIKEHSHEIQTVVSNKARSISLLQMPPTNGRVISRMSETENSVSIFASVEPVEIDAAAIHSLLTAINRPEISSVVADLREDIRGVQSHLEKIFCRRTKPISIKSKSEEKQLVYNAHLTLAGFDIFANAKGAQSDQNTARLDLNLGCVQIVLANRLDHEGPVLTFPELRIGLRQVMFGLSRWNNNSMEPCGNLAFTAFLTATSRTNDSGAEVRSFHFESDGIEVNIFAETASSVLDVMGHLQDKIKDLDLSREKDYLRKLRKAKPRIPISDESTKNLESMSSSSIMFASMYSLELLNIQVSWLVGAYEEDNLELEVEDLVLSLKRVHLSTRKENSARLTIEDLQLQMVPSSHDKSQRSLNSALLPEIVFNVGYVSTADARRFAFQAAGKSLDLRLTSQFIIPAAEIKKSIASAADKVRTASASWMTTTSGIAPTRTNRRQPFFGKKRTESLLVDADFAGAVVYLSGKKASDMPRVKGSGVPQAGRYGQFTHKDTSSSTTLRAPGLAWKVEYKDGGIDEPSLNAEVKVDASSNILYPAVVPLIMEITSTVKEVVRNDDKDKTTEAESETKVSAQKFMSADEDNILTVDPSAVLGRTRLNLGIRICRQEFSLSCQPIARVAATARFDNIYLTVNTVRSTEHGHFFAASAAITKLQASVQHVYSRESTGSFDVDSMFLSLMNSKHVSGTSGISAILKISPMKVLVNAKQLQDFLLFREIWVPVEIRQPAPSPAPVSSTAQSQTFLVQRYQQVAATGAFPWNATVSIAELDVQLDLGQALGKTAFMISQFWISSKKNSDWEQNLCMGFDKVGVNSTGRMSGLVALQDFKIRTSIQWPAREMALNQTPLIQGSLGFSQLRIKAAFDYQAFLVADITSFEFLMYNVRNSANAKGDRLVAILDGEAVQVFCTTTTASQALALYQAILRLVQEKRTNYETSLSEIEKFMKRKSVAHPLSVPKAHIQSAEEEKTSKSPISLHTDVIVTLKAVNMGAFPNTFSDHQVFKLEALNAQARFAVTMDDGSIHSILGLTLGQLRIGLAGVKRTDVPKSVSDLSVEDVVSSATGSRGGTILKVPKVGAIMQTWQVPGSNHIDYIFKSSFEGKVEVGWNYSRISYIRGMWASHSKALAQRLGKPLPPSAVKITGVPDADDAGRNSGEQQKITAEVNVPQSKYDYTALEPPIIETPQLRDMGEAVSEPIFADSSIQNR